MAARRNVPLAEELRVHRRVDAPPPPSLAHDEMGHEPVQTTVDEHRADVDGQLHRLRTPQPRLVTRSANGAAQITTEEPDRRYRLRRPPRVLHDRACLC